MLTLANCVFVGNESFQGGSVAYDIVGGNSVQVTNCTFWGNTANTEGGGMWSHSGSTVLTNSILWGNSDACGGGQIYNSASTPAISHSDVEGSGGSGPGWDPNLGSDLGGNLDASPRFARPVDPNTAPTPAGDLRLGWESPAMDAGDNSRAAELATRAMYDHPTSV